MVTHNSKALLKSLSAFVISNVTPHRSSFEVSDVKRDGTVFVRFRSEEYVSADTLTNVFVDALALASKTFEQTDDNKVRLPINQGWYE